MIEAEVKTWGNMRTASHAHERKEDEDLTREREREKEIIWFTKR